MSGVVLRCSTCGTTQAHAGECEACQEGKVRYFCGNHSPGIWLETDVCNLCGAKFGEVDRTPKASPPTPSLPPRKPSRAVSRPVTERPDPPKSPDPEEIAGPLLTLPELLAHLEKESSRGRFDVEDSPPRYPTAEAPRDRSVPVLGCLLRAVILLLVFIFFALGGLSSC